MNRALFSSARGTWRTPRKLYAALDKEFRFTMDAAPPDPKTDSLNALTTPWAGRVFVNPPYGRNVGYWVERAYVESGKGALVVMLLAARTDTQWFHDYCMRANEIRFVRGRLHFDDGPGRATFPSMIVVWRP